MKPSRWQNLVVFVIYVLVAYPMFYYSYKYFDPTIAIVDYIDYYPAYKDFDLSAVESPFNTRLISPYLVHLFYSSGLHYDTEISFQHPELEPEVLFSALTVSFLAVVLTCFFVYLTVREAWQNSFYAMAMGALYLLGFFTLAIELAPITDGFAVFMFALGFYLYQRKSPWIFLVLAALVVQREFVLIIFGILSAVAIIREKRLNLRDYDTWVLFFSIACFLSYFALRKTVFYTPTYDHQINIGAYVDSLLTTRFDVIPYLKQTFLTQNLLFIYLMVLAYKMVKRLAIDYYDLLVITGVFIASILISFAVVLGNSTGRYFYIVAPALIYYLAKETLPLLRSSLTIGKA